VSGPPDTVMRLQVRDFRIQGQRPALASYVARTLRFPSYDLTDASFSRIQ
jgi:hypothetical protein